MVKESKLRTWIKQTLYSKTQDIKWNLGSNKERASKMIMLANTKQEIQADPRAMRKKYFISTLYCFYQDADTILHHHSRR